MDSTALAVLSIFGGAALTALAGLVGAVVQARREHRRWIREQRLLAYQRVHKLVERMRYGDQDHDAAKEWKRSLNAMFDEAGLPESARSRFLELGLEAVGGEHPPRAIFDWTREIVAEKIDASALLSLVGPHEVEAALERVFEAITDKKWDAYGRLLADLDAAMRAGLNITL